MLTAYEARLAGMLVSAFRRQTADDVPVAVFLCGERTATGHDDRFVEAFIGSERARFAFDAADVLLEAELYTARELRRAVDNVCYEAALRRAQE